MGTEKRFITIYKDGSIFQKKILLDTETGVNYLFISEGYGAGLTALLDKDGKPVVTPFGKKERSWNP